VTTAMFYGSRWTQRCLKRCQRCTEASSPACMAARWLGSLAGACLRPRRGAGSDVRAPGDREGSDACENRARGGAEGRGPWSGVLQRGALCNKTDQIIRAQVQKQTPKTLKFSNLSPYNPGSQLKSRRISNQLAYNQDRIIQLNTSHIFHKYWIKSFTTPWSRNYYKPSL
jgi:hypothetical protein